MPYDNNRTPYRGSSEKRPYKQESYKRSSSQNSSNKTRKNCFTLLLDKETPQYVIDDLIELQQLRAIKELGLHMRIGVPEKGGLDTKPIRDFYGRNTMLMLPWEGFDDTRDAYCTTTDKAKGIYKGSTMSDLSDAVLTIAALKVNLLLGESCENPSRFMLTWTIDGAESIRSLTKDTGYLSPAIKLAIKNDIRVLNLNNAATWDDMVSIAERSVRN